MTLWQRIRAALVRLGIAGLVVGLLAGIVLAAMFNWWFPQWTGFAAPPVSAQGEVIPQGKTLWDWLQLLLVPLVLAVGGFWLTRTENRYALQLQERREQEARTLERERVQEARRIEEQRAQDAALQAYLEAMTQLLLDRSLRTSQPNDDIRSVARARTLTVLSVLDIFRKATVVLFLYEAKLIGYLDPEDQEVEGVISLEGANLKKIHLGEVYLEGVDLEGADLEGAYLEGADLTKANLADANLEGAVLYGAWLDGANLSRAKLTNIILPDGTTPFDIFQAQ
jgi:hypothetical protein